MNGIIDETSIGVLRAPHTRPVEQAGDLSRDVPSGGGRATDQSPADHGDLQKVAATVQERINERNISLSFSTYGKGNHKISVTVIDKNTGEVIREIPSEEVQRLSGKLEEMLGMVFDKRV